MKTPKKTIKKTTNWLDIFAADIAAAMSKAGIAKEASATLKWESVTVERTWGDKVGLVFFGATPEINERAAKYFYSWVLKHRKEAAGHYESVIDHPVEMTWVRFTNGVEGWHRYRNKPVVAKTIVEVRPGLAVSYKYIPE